MTVIIFLGKPAISPPATIDIVETNLNGLDEPPIIDYNLGYAAIEQNRRRKETPIEVMKIETIPIRLQLLSLHQHLPYKHISAKSEKLVAETIDALLS